MLFSQKISWVSAPKTYRRETQQSQVNTLVIFLVAIIALACPVISVEESMCIGPGFNNLYFPYIKTGFRSPGWDRLHAVNAPWTGYFWSVTSKSNESDVSPGSRRPQISLNYVEYRKGSANYILNGWIHINMDRSQGASYHYAAIWAVTHRNEPYGSFIFNEDPNFVNCPKKKGIYTMPYAYIPCSAGTSNADSVSNMFVFADLDKGPSNSSTNKVSFVDASVRTKSTTRGPNELSVVWRAPAQTYCNRPPKFKFVFAVTPQFGWEGYAKNWDSTNFPTEMWKGRDSGPLLWNSDWIITKYYGHPSNYDPYERLHCGVELRDSTAWITGYGPYPPIEDYWYSTEPWPVPSPGTPVKDKQPNFDALEPKMRSSCRAFTPKHNYIEGFGGRCTSFVSSQHLEYIYATLKTGPQCHDGHEQMAIKNFTKHYNFQPKGSYLKDLKTRLESSCECEIVTNQIVSMKILMRPPPLPWHPGVSRSFKLQRSKYKGEYHRDHDVCSIGNFSVSTINDKGGICLQTPVGKLVYGVRQWHGVTSLCVTIIITPLSIFIARYTKGDMVLLDGKVQIRAWYLTHVVLVFPSIWMYASGMATISRQVDVLGHSMTLAAYLHRYVGIFTIGLIPFLAVTGFIRPVNLKARNILIFLHWFLGLLYHFLELLLCFLSYLIPASPTTKSSVFSRYFGNFYRSSRVSALILGWFVFSFCFNVMLTVRIMIHDREMGNTGRSVFPIIIPLFSRDVRQDVADTEHSHELCFERGALFIFGLVSSVVFAVSIVSLYQALHEKLYYGFGPMSCTHNVFGEFVSDNHTQNSEKISDECYVV